MNVVIDWEQLHAGAGDPAAASTDLAVSPAAVRQLLCDANVARIVVGTDSVPLDVARSRRTAPRWIRRAITVRDQGCRFPGCDRRPSWCEAHHVWAWEAGGPTAVTNLVLLCPFHHHVVHRLGWRAAFDGVTFRVTDPAGRIVGSTRNAARTRAGPSHASG